MHFHRNRIQTIQKILVRSPNWVGDQIMAYPFFQALRKQYPLAKITVVSVPWVASLQFLDCVDEVQILTRPASPMLWDRWQALEKEAHFLKSLGPWDLGIVLPRSFSSAWLFYRAGVHQRWGYTGEGRSFLLSKAFPWEKAESLHRSDTYVQLLGTAMLDAFEKQKEDLRAGGEDLKMHWDPAHSWKAALPLTPPEEDYWILAPGATAESRRWPVERFAELAHRVCEKTGWKGLIIGGSGERALASELLARVSAQFSKTELLSDWTGMGTVAQYWKIFQKAKLSVCNDSGLAHVAAFCGSPVHIVWGAGRISRTQPLGPGKVWISCQPVKCWPCEQNTCEQPTETQWACLTGIQVDSVWKEIAHGLQLDS